MIFFPPCKIEIEFHKKQKNEAHKKQKECWTLLLWPLGQNIFKGIRAFPIHFVIKMQNVLINQRTSMNLSKEQNCQYLSS